jgi:hypothetical protein
MGGISDALSAAFVNVAGNISAAMGLASQAVAVELGNMAMTAATKATEMRDAFGIQLTEMEGQFGTMSTAAIAALTAVGDSASILTQSGKDAKDAWDDLTVTFDAVKIAGLDTAQQLQAGWQAVIDKMNEYNALNDIVIPPPGPPDEGVPGAASGGYVQMAGIVRVHGGETIVPAGKESGLQIVVNVNGPVYGMDDLDRVIADSVRNVYRRGGLSFTGRAG